MGRMKLSVSSYFFIASFLVLIFFHTRGVIVHDEGYVLNSAVNTLSGQTLYRDFHFSYTPGSVYLVTLFFYIFGQSVLASRILMILVSFVSVFLIFKTSKIITKRDIYGYVSSILFLAWGPSHINFAWPVMFVLPASLLILYLLAKNSYKKYTWVPFTTGFLCIIVFLFKQNFGIIFVPVLLALLTARNRNKSDVLYATYGLLWGVIIFCSYLLATGSFSAFVFDFYTFTIKKVLLNNDITTPLFYSDTPVKIVARTLLYFSPLYLSIFAIGLLIYRKRYYLLHIPLTVLLFLFVGIRPTTDYVHVVPILSLVGLPIIIIANQLPTSIIKLTVYSFVILLILLGFHSALFRGYYRWDRMLSENNQYVGGKVKVLTNPQFASINDSLSKLVDQNSKKGDYIFINTYAPLEYFILERRNPTPYDFPGFVSPAIYEQSVIYNLIAKDVKIVFMISENDETAIGKYVKKNYIQRSHIGDYFIFIKLDNKQSER